MRISLFLARVVILGLLLTVVGCNQVLIAEPVPVTPTVENKGRWITGPVIAMISRKPLECFYCYFSIPPESILYSDGRQIVMHETYLYERHLSPEKICDLITETDRSGFFEYSSEEYEEFYQSNHLKPAPEYYRFDIDAWKSNSLSLFSFGFLFSQYKEKVEWPAELSIIYERLTEFDPDSMHPYLPERVAIHIEKDPDLGFELGTWTIASPSPEDLVARYNNTATPESELSEGEMVLYGDEAKAVLKQFEDRPWGAEQVFVVNNIRYVFAVRVLLPYENSGSRDLSVPLIPDPKKEYQPISMSCP